jgi:hypothetical protein
MEAKFLKKFLQMQEEIKVETFIYNFYKISMGRRNKSK